MTSNVKQPTAVGSSEPTQTVRLVIGPAPGVPGYWLALVDNTELLEATNGYSYQAINSW